MVISPQAVAQKDTAWTSWTRRWRVVAPLSLPLLFGCLLVVYAWVVGFNRGQAYNSDQLHAFLLVQDLLRDPSAIFDWYHSPAAYVWPDWVLAAIPSVLQVPDRLVPLFFGGVQLTLLSIAGGSLVAVSTRTSIVAATWTTAALLILFAGAALSIVGGAVTPSALVALGVPFIHVGAILMTIVSAALLVERLDEPSHGRSALLLAASVFAAAFSDFLFIVWFVAPACVVSLLHSWATRSRWGLRTFGLIVGSTVVALLIEHVLREGYGLSGYIVLVGPIASVTALTQHFGLAWGSGDYTLGALLALLVALLTRSVFLLAKALRRQPLQKHELAELFIGGSCGSALLAPLSVGLYSDLAHWRYLLILFFVPLLWVGVWIVIGLKARAALFGGIAAAVVLGSSLMVSAKAVETVRGVAEPWELEACLDAEGRTTGISGYWPAKLTMLMTSRRIHLVQISERGGLYRWNYNRRWFTERDDGTAVEPDFIILEDLNPDMLRMRFGAPSRSISCGTSEVWLYDRPLDVFSPDRVYSGAELPGELGSVEGTVRRAQGQGGASGIMTFGPYADLRPGVYEVRIRYSATGPGHAWDIAQGLARSIPVRGALDDTGGKVHEVTIDLNVDLSFSTVEVRTYFGGSGDLTLHEIGIRKK